MSTINAYSMFMADIFVVDNSMDITIQVGMHIDSYCSIYASANILLNISLKRLYLKTSLARILSRNLQIYSIRTHHDDLLTTDWAGALSQVRLDLLPICTIFLHKFFLKVVWSEEIYIYTQTKGISYI